METDLPSIAKQLRALDRAEIKSWLRRGELLTAARELNPNDDAFRKWLRDNKLAKTTAYAAMAAWRDFGDCPDSGHFTKDAMRVLAQNAQARQEAIELAERQKITAKIAKALVAKHGPPVFGSTPATREKAPLSAHTSGWEEIFNVEGFTFVVSGNIAPLPSDLLGAVMELQRIVRGRITRAA